MVVCFVEYLEIFFFSSQVMVFSELEVRERLVEDG